MVYNKRPRVLESVELADDQYNTWVAISYADNTTIRQRIARQGRLVDNVNSARRRRRRLLSDRRVYMKT